MKIFWMVIITIVVIYVFSLIIQVLFGTKKGSDDGGSPPDDRYPTW